MSLPWFPFNIKDFLANTKRLNTEAKGAYLCLMLDYYQQAAPPPDDDEVLATICELPIDAWRRHRKVIEPLFQVRDGLWHHDRIETEIADGIAKHASRSEKARTAALAKAEQFRSKHPERPAPSMPQASSKTTQTQTHTLSNERVHARAREDDDNPKVQDGLARKEEAEPSNIATFNPIGTVLNENWVPDAKGIETAHRHGMTDADLQPEVEKFHALNKANGTVSKDWPSTWQMWCARFKERQEAKPKRPAARVEVSNTVAEKDWEWAASMWAKGSSTWSHKTYGPEPGQPGCKCPPEILIKHGIDPAAGRVTAKERAS